MATPFPRDSRVSYGAVAHCMLSTMSLFNLAAERAAQQGETCECSICHDTLGPGLVMVALPGCNHRFHEICIQTWLSPIQVPDTTREPVRFWSACVDSVFRNIEDRTLGWAALALLPPDTPVYQAAAAELSTGNDIDSDVGEALEAAYDQDEEMAEELGDELEEGEIQEVQSPPNSQEPSDEELEEYEVPTALQIQNTFRTIREQFIEAGVLLPESQEAQRYPQDLPEISDDYIFDDARFPPREPSHQCPYCRRPVFFTGPVGCHADTLQLIRVRLRLTDLAYRFLGFSRTDQENKDRETVTKYLDRRHADNITLGEREIPLTPRSCRRVFRQARSMLRKEAYVYGIRHEIEGTDEGALVEQFGTFFEKFGLRDEHTAFFFDANPAFNEILWAKNFKVREDQKLLLTENDRRFYETLRLDGGIEPHSYTPWPESESPSVGSDLSMSDGE
ncbi:MAG: hypothetical protein Q9171_001086 [Xanthocarpia ochracea]